MSSVQRRVNNPVERLSNNQIIGFIDISRDQNPELLDQTNREGFIHNKAMEDLRRLVYFVLQLLEAERQSVRHPVARPGRVIRETRVEAQSSVAGLEQVAAAAPPALAREIRQARARIEEMISRQAGASKKLVEGYFGLAAVGQMASGLAQFLPGKVARLHEEVKNLRRTLNGSTDPTARKTLDQLAGAMTQINDSLRMLLIYSGAGERRRAIDIAAELEAFRELIEPVLSERGIKLAIDCPGLSRPPHPQPLSPARNVSRAISKKQGGGEGSAVLRTDMRPEIFQCLLQILAANAMDWLRPGRRGQAPFSASDGKVIARRRKRCLSPLLDEPRIRIEVEQFDDVCELLFSDNGPGIPRGVGGRIFEPLFSRKEAGRGMGLTIARQLVEAHGGAIDVLLDGRRKGANFVVTLPRKKSRATIY